MNTLYKAKRATHGKAALAAAALAACGYIGLAPAPVLADAFEDFTIEPTNWVREGVLNGEDGPDEDTENDRQNFGWRDSNTVGTSVNPPGGIASGAGEAGGTMSKRSAASYGAMLPQPLNLSHRLYTSGVVRYTSGEIEDTLFGWYNSFASEGGVTQEAGHRPQMIGWKQVARAGDAEPDANHIQVFIGNEGTAVTGDFRRTVFNGDGFGTAGRVLTDETFAFEMLYDPYGGVDGDGDGLPEGSLTIRFYNALDVIADEMPDSGAPDGDDFNGPDTYTYNLTAAQRNLVHTYDRFGMATAQLATSVARQDGFYDDLTYTDAPTTPSAWDADAPGNWSLAGNWVGDVPNGVNALASFGDAITAARTVTLDAPQTVGLLLFDNDNSYSLAGTSALTLDVSLGRAHVIALSGDHTISAPVVLNANADITVDAGASVAFTGSLDATGKAITKKGAGDAQFENVRAVNLAVQAGTARISAKTTANDPAGTSVVNSLTINSAGVLDLTNNSLVIDYDEPAGNGDLVTSVREHLAGNRLTTTSGSLATGLGYGDNAILAKTSFGGQTVDDSSVLIKFTYFGDSDLDGDVDVADLGNLASAWQTEGVWTNGDFDYSGFIDVADLGLLASSWQAGVGSPLGPSFAEALASVGLSGVTVPEPACGAIGLAGCWLLRRSARRQRVG